MVHTLLALLCCLPGSAKDSSFTNKMNIQDTLKLQIIRTTCTSKSIKNYDLIRSSSGWKTIAYKPGSNKGVIIRQKEKNGFRFGLKMQDIDTVNYIDFATALNDSDIILISDFEKRVRNRINNKPGNCKYYDPISFSFSMTLANEKLKLYMLDCDQWILDFIDTMFSTKKF